tara:strand:- start:9 stop:188 length:180 start_codon:yes stop_codon:yes gene_type:complete
MLGKIEEQKYSIEKEKVLISLALMTLKQELNLIDLKNQRVSFSQYDHRKNKIKRDLGLY